MLQSGDTSLKTFARTVMDGRGRLGPSFSLQNRIQRSIFLLAWLVLAKWTPPPLHAWRCFVLRLFGARIGKRVRLYGSTRVWLPSNLAIGDETIIGRDVHVYNQGRVEIGARAVVSQGAHLCASTHDVSDPDFRLVLRSVRIEDHVWIAADAFVGPGVTVGEGAVLGARGVAMKELARWTVHAGNPAQPLKSRAFRGTPGLSAHELHHHG